MRPGNFFHGLDLPDVGERFEVLLAHRNLRIERILSSSHLEPVEYLQAEDEWVMLIAGQATLILDGETIELVTGDYRFIPANTPHSVEKASDGALWLAVHLESELQD